MCKCANVQEYQCVYRRADGNQLVSIYARIEKGFNHEKFFILAKLFKQFNIFRIHRVRYYVYLPQAIHWTTT